MKRINPWFKFLILSCGLWGDLVGGETPARAMKNQSLGFPVGIYTSGKLEHLEEIRDAGFNLVTGSATKEYLDAAHQLGLKVFASPGTSAGPGFKAAPARKIIRQWDAHPAMWAWYVIDEPDLAGVSPTLVQHAYRELKRAGARKPLGVVLFQGQESRFFASSADILLIDRYPVPWIPTEHFGQHVEMARLGAGQDKPVIAIIQAFDWSYYPELMPQESGLRVPSRKEIRNMTFDALARGANGLFYYSFDSGNWKMRGHPEVWEDLCAVVAEVNELKPLFEAEHQWWHRRLVIQEYSRRFNMALQPSISTELLRVNEPNRWVPKGDYLIAVNNTTNSLHYRFHTPKAGTRLINVVRENRQLIAVEETFVDSVESLGVKVYGPF